MKDAAEDVDTNEVLLEEETKEEAKEVVEEEAERETGASSRREDIPAASFRAFFFSFLRGRIQNWTFHSNTKEGRPRGSPTVVPYGSAGSVVVVVVAASLRKEAVGRGAAGGGGVGRNDGTDTAENGEKGHGGEAYNCSHACRKKALVEDGIPSEDIPPG